MRRDDLFPFHVILSSRDRHESRRKIRSKGKMEGKVKEIGRQRRGIETVALRTCIEYLKESIYISVLSPISIFSSRRNKESKDLRSILVSPPRYEKEIYLNLWHCAGKNSVSKESISPLRRNLEREEDSKRSMSPAEEISRDVSSLVRLEPVSQSVSQSVFRRGKWWRDVDIVGGEEMGCQRLVRVSSWLCDESHLSSLASITG